MVRKVTERSSEQSMLDMLNQMLVTASGGKLEEFAERYEAIIEEEVMEGIYEYLEAIIESVGPRSHSAIPRGLRKAGVKWAHLTFDTKKRKVQQGILQGKNVSGDFSRGRQYTTRVPAPHQNAFFYGANSHKGNGLYQFLTKWTTGGGRRLYEVMGPLKAIGASPLKKGVTVETVTSQKTVKDANGRRVNTGQIAKRYRFRYKGRVVKTRQALRQNARLRTARGVHEVRNRNTGVSTFQVGQTRIGAAEAYARGLLLGEFNYSLFARFANQQTSYGVRPGGMLKLYKGQAGDPFRQRNPQGQTYGSVLNNIATGNYRYGEGRAGRNLLDAMAAYMFALPGQGIYSESGGLVFRRIAHRLRTDT